MEQKFVASPTVPTPSKPVSTPQTFTIPPFTSPPPVHPVTPFIQTVPLDNKNVKRKLTTEEEMSQPDKKKFFLEPKKEVADVLTAAAFKDAKIPSFVNVSTTQSFTNPMVPNKVSGSTEEDMLNKWTSQDDMLLKEAVQNIGSFDKICRSVKFSFKFSANDLENRWKALLYNPNISQQAVKGMVTLPTTAKRVLWTPLEEEILKQEVNGSFISFQHILEKYRDKFHSSRTAKSLEAHYYRMKRTGAIGGDVDPTKVPPKPSTPTIPSVQQQIIEIVPSQKAQSLSQQVYQAPKEFEHLDFISADAVTLYDSMHPNENGKTEMASVTKAEYQKREKELNGNIALGEKALDNQDEANVLACLRGRVIKHQMKTREILIGRGTKETPVDVDLSEEGADNRISRKQAYIKIKHDGELYIKNIGKRTIFVNGKPLPANQRKKLSDNSIIEIENLRLLFEHRKQYYKIKSLLRTPCK